MTNIWTTNIFNTLCDNFNICILSESGYNLFFKKGFFWCGPFLKSLLNLLQYCFLFLFWFWGHETWDPSSPNSDQTCIPFNRRQSLNHWTTREVPAYNTYVVSSDYFVVIVVAFFLLKGRNVLDNKNWVKWDAIWKFILKCLRVYLLLKFPATICIIVNIIHIILLLKNPWHFLLLLFFLFFSAFLTSVDLDFCKLSSEKKFMFGFPLWLRW